jgi:hypothetical protein
MGARALQTCANAFCKLRRRAICSGDAFKAMHTSVCIAEGFAPGAEFI